MGFEKFIEKFRYIVYVPIISLIFSTVFIFGWTLKNYVFLANVFTASEQEIIIGFISSFDLFLLGILSMIFAVSLYDLYIKPPGRNTKLPPSLIISNLEDLKNKVAKLLYLILLITFFKYAFKFEYKTTIDLALFAISILAVALSIYFTTKKNQ